MDVARKGDDEEVMENRGDFRGGRKRWKLSFIRSEGRERKSIIIRN